MRRSNLRAAVSVALSSLVVVAAGCAKVIGIEDTELKPGVDFTCVGKVPVPMGDGSDVEIFARIVDIATGTPVEGVRVVPCRTRLDLTCGNADAVFSDASGDVHVPVKSGYNGYLRIEDPAGGNTDESLVTYFWYFSEPIVETRAEPFPIFAMTRGFRRDVVYSGASGYDPTLGELAINATDCGDVNAPGVRFEITTPTQSVIDDTTVPFYFADGLINIPTNESAERTDASGIGGYIGVKPSQVGIRAILAATGETIAQDTLLVQKDILTTVRLVPQ